MSKGGPGGCGEAEDASGLFVNCPLMRSKLCSAPFTVADAYMPEGEKELAREHAQKSLALLDAHTTPASSWSDSEPYRGEVRRSAQKVLEKLNGA
jgi:hypothetical protein